MTDSVVHETGAKRSKDADGVRFDLLSPIVLMNLAATFAEGAHKYGEHNYQKGFKISGLLNHAMRHIQLFLLGDTSEDHLGHAAWNINAAIHFMHIKPEMDDRYKYNLTPEQIQEILGKLQFKSEG